MKRLWLVLVIIWGMLALAAVLASSGVTTTVGIWAHIVPAGLIYSAVDALGLQVSAHGAFVRSAHGPPFLGPVGFMLVYVLPLAILLCLLLRRPR